MDEKLSFSLPEKKQGTAFMPKVIILLLLILIGLTTAGLLRPFYQPSSAGSAAAADSSENVKELASKLADRGLYVRAARVWQDYLTSANLSDTERAKTLFQAGTLLEKAGLYEEAIESYYRSENTSKLSDLEQQINDHVKNCFEKLGKFSALRYELMDRTSFQKSGNAGGKVVAEIGAEKITESDLDATIEKTIDNQMASMKAFMTDDQCNEQKKKILEQYRTPSARQEFLQSWLAQEILYRQALEQKLSEQPQTKAVIDDVVRGVLSQQLMNQELASKIHITESDLQTYYQANKDKFTKPTNPDDPNSPMQPKTFDEARQQVIDSLLGQKRREVQADLIKQMMDKYNVVIHASVFQPAQSENEQPASKAVQNKI